MRGLRPTPTRISSPSSTSPFSSVSLTTPLRSTPTAREPVWIVDAAGGERLLHVLGSRAPPRARSAVARLRRSNLRAERRPRLAELDADDAAAEDEQPLGNGARRRAETVRPRRARRRARGSAGSSAPVPVASTIAWRACARCRRRRSCARRSRRALPRSNVTPRSSSHGTCTESSRSWITWSRRLKTASTSSSPVAASAAPGMRRASSSASAGRSSAFDGMHA